MGRVPKSVKVVSILCIIYGAFGLLFGGFGLIQIFFLLSSQAPANNPMQDPTVVKISLVASVARIMLGTLLLASAIGGLKLKRWGRMGLNTYALIYVLEMLVMGFLQIVFVLPKTLEALKGQPNMTDQMIRIGGIAGIVVTVLIVLWALGVSLTILITFNRKIAVDAFNGILPEDNSQNDQPIGGVV